MAGKGDDEAPLLGEGRRKAKSGLKLNRNLVLGLTMTGVFSFANNIYRSLLHISHISYSNSHLNSHTSHTA